MTKLSKEEKQVAWHNGILSWKLHTAQIKMYNSIRNLDRKIREVLVFCSRRLGKSYLGCSMAVEDCIQNPGATVFIIGPSRKQTLGIVKPIMRKIGRDAPKGLFKITSQATFVFANGSEIVLGGFDTALEDMRGKEAFNIYLEETGLAPADIDEYLYIFKSVYLPTLQHSRGRIIHLTTPSRRVDHPLHTETLPKAQMNGAFLKFTIEDNPLLTKEEIEEEIKELGGRDSPHTRRELFCEIVRDDSAVAVPAFSEEHHVIDTYYQQWANYLIAGDFGGSQDLHFWLLITYDHDIGVPVVMDERWWPASTTTPEIVKVIDNDWKGFTQSKVVDMPSQTRIDLASVGFSTYLPKKENFIDTLVYLRAKFYMNEVMIHPRCQKLIATLRSGMLNAQRNDWERTPTLGHCDGLMALVYGLRYIDQAWDRKPKRRSENTFNIAEELASNPYGDLNSLFEH